MTTLLESTGAPTVDRILQGVIGILEQAFPDRVRGYFVRGSYASATSTEGSDLDMFVVFKDAFVEPAEAQKARSICRHCGQLSPILLEILVVSEAQLHHEDNLVIALQLKLASRPVYAPLSDLPARRTALRGTTPANPRRAAPRADPLPRRRSHRSAAPAPPC